MGFFSELIGFLKTRKKYWLIPAIIVLVLLGFIISLTATTALAPFIYTIF